jgi:uncharacterized protein GlcG (DUF336 family)
MLRNVIMGEIGVSGGTAPQDEQVAKACASAAQARDIAMMVGTASLW